MGKVYVTQETAHSFLEAERFGEVVFLTKEDLNNTKGSLHNEEVIRSLRASLRDFDPGEDYVAPVGSPYVMAVVFLILGNMGFKSIKVLRWNNRDFMYIPMFLSLGNSK